MKTWLAPIQYDRRYGRFSKKNIAVLKDEFLRRLGRVRRFKAIASKAPDEQEILTQETMAASESEQIDSLIAFMLLWWSGRKAYASSVIRGYFREINTFNDNQFKLVVKSLTGLSLPSSQSIPYQFGKTVSPIQDLAKVFGEDSDIYREEPYLPEIQTNWETSQDVYLDKTVVSTISDLELILRQAVAVAIPVGGVLVAIDKKIDTVSNRVERTAKDQVNNLDTQLSEMRQKSLGANEYIWDTRKDERVRGNPNGLYPKAKPSHWHRQNQIFNWNSPPEGGHPGQAPGCRCRAIMRLRR